jgi:hypothetical protein
MLCRPAVFSCSTTSGHPALVGPIGGPENGKDFSINAAGENWHSPATLAWLDSANRP